MKNRFVGFQDTHVDPQQSTAFYRAEPTYMFHYEVGHVKGLAVMDRKTKRVYVIFVGDQEVPHISLLLDGAKMVKETVAQHRGKL